MTKTTLQRIIRAGGATLDKNGAAVAFENGYQVSRRDCYTLDVLHVGEVLDAVNGLLAKIGAGDFVGLWVNAGRVYIDISERVERLGDALRIGRERGQKAVFDWATKNDILCKA